jgi:hypothetical protein
MERSGLWFEPPSTLNKASRKLLGGHTRQSKHIWRAGARIVRFDANFDPCRSERMQKLILCAALPALTSSAAFKAARDASREDRK